MLNLLKLDDQIQSLILALDRFDERLKIVTERRLRPLVQIPDSDLQKEQFLKVTGFELKGTI